jgi:DNA-binding response OmpR family regulator/two-component sensor histidine kinase
MVTDKLNWFQKIAHEFRTPLTIIFGAVDQLRDQSIKQSEIIDSRVEQIADQATHLTRQIDEILELAKVQEGAPKLQLEEGDFIAFQQRILRAHQHLADQKNIDLQFHSAIKSLHFAFDHDKCHKITGNLLSNALKFTPTGGTGSLIIAYADKVVKESIILKVKDSGPGISTELLPLLFEPFRQAEAHQGQGTGLGLALTKALVELHGGTISVHSKLNTGSTFTIELPITKEAHSSKVNRPTNNYSPLSDNEAIVLIAEDHPEIRDHLESCLDGRYQILMAKDGLEAWELCQKHIPDLIVSDIMMPGKTGLELGHLIRSDQRTNHIPLILLTAKSGDSARMEGLEAGADEYLTKPFRRRELELRIERLLAYQQSLIKKYQNGDFSVQRSSKRSDTFMQNVVQIIRKKLDDDNFSVQILADALYLSRVQVFRKIKALTGQTPTLFIRQIRLQTAHQLIQQTDQTIAEIAFQVGFKDPAYFSRVFTEVYGFPPSSLR